MATQRALSELTREELHDLIWSLPATKLAADFGVSDVAVAKRCRKLNVPRPARGYWAKIEAGHKPKKPPLPASPADAFAEQVLQPIASSIALPAETEILHPVAVQFLAAIKSSALSHDKQRVHLKEPEFPEADISKAQAPRAAGVLQTLFTLVESRGIPFRKNQGKYDGGYFRKGNDRLHFKIEEELIDKPASPGRRRNHYSNWQQQENKVAGGRLTFSVNPENYGKQQEKRWSESEKMPLEAIVAAMAKEICRHFMELQKRHAAEVIEREKQRVEAEIRWKKHQEEEAIRIEQEKKRKHAAALEAVARNREEDLLKAAEWWRLHRGIDDFIADCERRWRAAQSGELSPEQQAWLAWAREVATGVSPLATGYPDPAKDGVFDPATVPFGGPYPEQRKFPQPPTMPAIPAPVVVKQGYGEPSHQPASNPYPFWLKYQRR